jgi:hypothetical protein
MALLPADLALLVVVDVPQDFHEHKLLSSSWLLLQAWAMSVAVQGQ